MEAKFLLQHLLGQVFLPFKLEFRFVITANMCLL
nr:MAG TPA: hypothetical protein [Caudoviricetes sp.]DAK75839.1 MAG TPA: hypothetical protein [Caudoviricetes sp.]